MCSISEIKHWGSFIAEGVFSEWVINEQSSCRMLEFFFLKIRIFCYFILPQALLKTPSSIPINERIVVKR